MLCTQVRHKSLKHKLVSTHLVELEWRQGEPAPKTMTSEHGVAVVHGNTAYFSQGLDVYSYTVPENKWEELQSCKYQGFSLAIVSEKLTAIGGWEFSSVNTLFSLSGTNCKKWENILPSMPTKRLDTAAVTTPTHLVVAGGTTSLMGEPISTIEILNTQTRQWSTASCSPFTSSFDKPGMTVSSEYLYLYQNNVMLSCSVEELLQSCKPLSTSCSHAGFVWVRLADIPVPCGASLAILRGHVLAVGGSHEKRSYFKRNPTTPAIHCYDRKTNSWSLFGEMSTPRSRTQTVVLHNNELVVVGGDRYESTFFPRESKVTEVARLLS